VLPPPRSELVLLVVLDALLNLALLDSFVRDCVQVYSNR
jgi:hypothetical protein